MIVELRAVPDCPNLAGTRDLLRACLADAGLPLEVVERIGAYPSPSVLVDGRDVTGADPAVRRRVCGGHQQASRSVPRCAMPWQPHRP